MRALNRHSALRREFPASDRIPYLAHVAPHVVRTAFGDYLQTFRLGGASFETNDDAELNNWHERLNVLWRNIAAPSVALWSQVVRRRFTCRRSRLDYLMQLALRFRAQATTWRTIRRSVRSSPTI